VSSAPVSATFSGPELLRRLLLGLITALIVARPLVLGEDPGLLDHASGAAGLTLTLLWFLAAVGWAIWRAWSRQSSWSMSVVEGGLLAIVGAVMASAVSAASYKQPALLIASEWFVFLIAFVLVRQLARTEGDNQRLIAVLLASAVSLSAFGVYQGTVELPDQHKRFENPQRLVQALAKEGIYLDEKDPVLEHWKTRIQANTVFATFAHPNSFASFLALLLPAAVGWSLACGNRLGGSLKVWLGGGCALLIAVSLWLTNSRGAILASTVAVGAVIAFSSSTWWTERPTDWHRGRSGGGKHTGPVRQSCRPAEGGGFGNDAKAARLLVRHREHDPRPSLVGRGAGAFWPILSPLHEGDGFSKDQGSAQFRSGDVGHMRDSCFSCSLGGVGGILLFNSPGLDC
jgi:hypothetical protein